MVISNNIKIISNTKVGRKITEKNKKIKTDDCLKKISNKENNLIKTKHEIAMKWQKNIKSLVISILNYLFHIRLKSNSRVLLSIIDCRWTGGICLNSGSHIGEFALKISSSSNPRKRGKWFRTRTWNQWQIRPWLIWNTYSL